MKCVLRFRLIFVVFLDSCLHYVHLFLSYTKKNINKALFFFAIIVLKFLLRNSGRQEKENIHTFENANVEMNNIILDECSVVVTKTLKQLKHM